MDFWEHQLIVKRGKARRILFFFLLGTCISIFPLLSADFSLNRKVTIMIHIYLDVYIFCINLSYRNAILSVFKNIRLICWTANRMSLQSSWIKRPVINSVKLLLISKEMRLRSHISRPLLSWVASLAKIHLAQSRSSESTVHDNVSFPLIVKRRSNRKMCLEKVFSIMCLQSYCRDCICSFVYCKVSLPMTKSSFKYC